MTTQTVTVEIELPDVEEVTERYTAMLDQQLGFIFPEIREEDRRVVLDHYGEELQTSIRSAGLVQSVLSTMRTVAKSQLGIIWPEHFEEGSILHTVAIELEEEVSSFLIRKRPQRQQTFLRADAILNFYDEDLGKLWFSAMMRVIEEAQNHMCPGLNRREEVDALGG